MKLLLSIIFILNCFTSFGQKTVPCEVEKVVEAPYHPPTIMIYKDDKLIDSSASIFRGESIYKFNELGKYKLVISAYGQKSLSFDSIIVAGHEVVSLIIRKTGPCI